MKTTLYKSKKIGKNCWSAGRPKRRLSLNVFRSLNILNHKNRWVVALAETDNNFNRTFRSCDTINRTEALRIISFLAEYVNLVKPTQATALAASIKASTNRTCKIASELSAIAVDTEIRNTND